MYTHLVHYISTFAFYVILHFSFKYFLLNLDEAASGFILYLNSGWADLVAH